MMQQCALSTHNPAQSYFACAIELAARRPWTSASSLSTIANTPGTDGMAMVSAMRTVSESDFVYTSLMSTCTDIHFVPRLDPSDDGFVQMNERLQQYARSRES